MPFRILILGDHPDHVAAIRQSAQRAGLEAIVVNSIDEGIECVNSTASVDVIICHAYIENGNVFDFIKAVKLNPALANIQFMLVSCTASELTDFFDKTLKKTSRLIGADKYIVMTEFDVDRLMREVFAALPKQPAA